MKSIWFLALVAAATAQQVTVVQVGNANGSLEFSPNNIQAAVGSLVQFQFHAGNHSVVSGDFNAPCQPATTGTQFFSGFPSVAAGSSDLPTFSIQINDTAPIWLYCSQAKHCQAGMVAVINQDPNSANTLSAFEKKVAVAPDSVSPGQTPSGGSVTTSSSAASSSSTSSSSSTTSKASKTPSSSPSSSPSTGSTPTGNTTSPSSTASTSDPKNGGLSTATVIGISVGAAIGAVAMIAGAIVLWFRSRRRRNTNRNSNLTSFQQPHAKPEPDETQMYLTSSVVPSSHRSAPPRPKRYTTRSLYAGQKIELDSRPGP